jgi:hypothetical protein
MQLNDALTSIDGADIPAPTLLAANGPNVPEKGQEKSESQSDKAPEAKSEHENSDKSKRFIPEHKKPDSALTFPEKVSAVLLYRSRPTRAF